MSRWITATMVDDFLHDPVLAAKVLLGYTSPPHMELRLWGMWTRQFFMDYSGSGAAKSLCVAITLALRIMLMEGRTEGLLSNSFRQGKIVARYFDEWYETSPYFRNEMRTNHRGSFDAHHGSDAWEFRARTGSIIRVIPPGWDREGKGGFSEDWTDVCFDEFSRYGSFDALRDVYFGRVRKPPPSQYDFRDPIFCNHFAFTGTAGYTFQPIYALVEQFLRERAAGNPKYEVQSWNYTHIPEEFDRLRSLAANELRLGSMRKDEVEREVLGHWVADSTGFYSAQQIGLAQTSECPILVVAA